MIAFGLYTILLLIFLLAQARVEWLYYTISPSAIIILCLYQYLYMPFNPAAPREFVFWSVILQFRCSVIVTMFQVNGLIDIILQLVLTLPIIALHSRSLVISENDFFIWPPIIVALMGCQLFNYIVSREQRMLFLLERVSKKQQEELIDILNLLPG